MICHELQAFKVCTGQVLTGHRSSRLAETSIQILSLRALLIEIGGHNLF